MSTSPELNQNQDPAHQAAVANLSRHFNRSVDAMPEVPNVTEAELQADSEVYAEAFTRLASMPEIQELAPGVKELVSTSAYREALRTEVGEERYDLVVDKMNSVIRANENEDEDIAKITESWTAQGAKFVKTITEHGGILPEHYTSKFATDRENNLTVAKAEVAKASEAIVSDEEVSEAFSGREADLQKLLDMHKSLVEENEDYRWVFNVGIAMMSNDKI